MKNLVAELDVLQTQLNQLKQLEHESKLRKTKFILEKSKQSEDVEDLEEKVQKIKQELANRKLHHCIKQVSRQIKNFKQLEPLKLKKRMKNAPAKKASLESELEIVKDMDIEDWAEYVSKAQLSKNFNSFLQFEKRAMPPAENNVYGRICKIPQLKEAVEAAVQSISEYYPSEKVLEKNVSNSTEQGAEDASQQDDSKKVSREDQKGNQKETKKEKTKKGQERAQKDLKSHSKKEAKESKDRAKSNDDSEEAPNFDDDFLQLPDVSMDADGDMEMGDSDSDAGSNDDFFIGPDGSALPELATGYISGSDSEDEPEEIKPERKNRRGQRARRAIWEQKYGKRAKHVVKEQQEKQKKYLDKQKRREFRVQKDSQRKEAENMRMQRKKELEAKPLHPSWIAKQQQDKLKSVKPQGKKIVFD